MYKFSMKSLISDSVSADGQRSLFRRTWAVAERWGGEATIYYFGDFDPSGVDISRNTEQRLQQFVDSDALTFKRVAVNEDQITELNLPTRPTKATDSRSKNFCSDISCEVDAIRPDVLCGMVRACISNHIDADQIKAAQEIEQQEPELLQDIRSRL